jgi:hypothetical protein
LKFFICPDPLILSVFCDELYSFDVWKLQVAAAIRAGMYRQPQEDLDNFFWAVSMVF